LFLYSAATLQLQHAVAAEYKNKKCKTM